MINFKHVLIIVILLSVFSGCIRQPVPSETPVPTVTPTPMVERTVVPTVISTPVSTELKAGLNKEFTISLESNPSTGYSWVAEADGDFLNLTNHSYIPDEPIIPGSAGKENFSFVPVKIGETNLIMLYKRPWEKDAIEERLFRIIITK